ncbi:MAG TPA: Rieske 2Fe-2S domain-containing protein [Acidimicrobiales bacterium]|nr:Rieske 2Fe-2S domain-containing protein [Acidimicrobiales bacterium]
MTDIREAEGFVDHMAIAARHPKRVEIVVGACFVIAILAVGALGAIYVQGGQPQIEGMLLFAIFGLIGFGMAAWGKWLMPRGPFVEEREVLTSESNQEKFAETFRRGESLRQGRRPFLLKLLIGATGAMGAILLFPLRSLSYVSSKAGGPLYHTQWKAGSLVVDENNQPIHVDTLSVGGVMTVFPQDFTDAEDDQTILLRASEIPVAPSNQPQKLAWSPSGYLAFSKVCTHAGCPVGQYESQYQKLLCPCHESTFDVLNACAVVFGPAPRPLPQLPLMVDANGHLRAQRGYDEPIGPGFWYRGG